MGQIRNISTQTTNVTYKLDDGTGTIEVKVWIDAEGNAEGMDADDGSKPKLVENGYARVFGRLKEFHNKRHVGAQVVRPITDHNEISYHMLEATVVHLHFTRGPLGEANGAAPAANGNIEQQNGYSDGGMNHASAVTGLSAAAKRVYTCLNTTPQGQEGLHMQDIASRLRMEMSDVIKGGEELIGAGVIYTTCDDETWAILNI